MVRFFFFSIHRIEAFIKGLCKVAVCKWSDQREKDRAGGKRDRKIILIKEGYSRPTNWRTRENKNEHQLCYTKFQHNLTSPSSNHLQCPYNKSWRQHGYNKFKIPCLRFRTFITTINMVWMLPEACGLYMYICLYISS